MNYYNAIKQTYPGILDSEFGLQDDSDGHGAYLTSWTFAEAPKPELATLRENTALSAVRTLRPVRDQLLADSDFRMLPDYPGSDQDDWKTYRDALRNLPDEVLVSGVVNWPIAPQG